MKCIPDNWDGRVWIPPFGFDPLTMPVTYRPFNRAGMAFATYACEHSFAPVKVEFPDGGGRWFGIRCALTTLFDPVAVTEYALSWPMPGNLFEPVPPFGIPPGVFEVCFPSHRGMPELIEFCFHHGRAFTFFHSGKGTRWFKCLDSRLIPPQR